VGYTGSWTMEPDYSPLLEGGGFAHDGVFGDR